MSEQSTPNRTLARLPVAVTLAVVLLYLYRLLGAGGGIVSQDFTVYYAAAAAVANGLNPYEMEVLQSFVPGNSLPFVYPLATTYLFRPFLIFPVETAAIFYALLKSLCLVYLIRLWVKNFLPRAETTVEVVLLWAILAFGLSLTIYCDLAGGNVSIIEQSLLWTGLLFFVRGRLGLFCVFVVLAASFKFALALALLLLLTTDFRWRSALMYLSFAAVAIVPAVSYWMSPQWFGEFLWVLVFQGAALRGFANPSLLAALDGIPYLSMIPYAPFAAYAVMVAFIWGVTTLILRRGVSRTEAVLLFSAAYALAVPRMSPYSYIILLPAISHLLLAWRIELPRWTLPAAVVALPVILSAHSISSVFVPWVAWMENFHHVVLSAVCFGWWATELRNAYPSPSSLTPKAVIESRAAPMASSVPESTPM